MKTALLANIEKASTSDFEKVRDVLDRESNLVYAQLAPSQEFGVDEAITALARRLFVMGGDGTLISVARRAAEWNIPIVGINYGKLGYLAHFSTEEIVSEPKVALSAAYSHRSTLRVFMNDQQIGMAINDAVIDIGPPFRTSELMVRVNRNQFSIIRGDGVIISTPTGSTAYNLSAGGPIVEPYVHGMLITPKNPHRLSVRPVMVSEGREISISMVGKHEGVYIVLDGQQIHPFTDGEVMVTTGHQLLLVDNRNHNYYETLTAKLGWGK